MKTIKKSDPKYSLLSVFFKTKHNSKRISYVAQFKDVKGIGFTAFVYENKKLVKPSKVAYEDELLEFFKHEWINAKGRI